MNGAPQQATRTAAVLVPDWSLVAARDRLERAGEKTGPLIVLDRHRVTHADPEAQEVGVLPGMRKRAAQAACPEAVAVESDHEQEGALFELVAAAVDTVAAGVDVLRPGVLLMAARGPARHQGGEERLAERIIDAVADRTGWDCQVGVADGSFAALLAARAGRIIRPGRSADYLAPHGIGGLREIPGAVKDLAEVIDLLSRLGIRTLGDFADLPSASVQARFGPEVARLHLLASGGEIEPPATHHPEQAIEVVRVMDPPLVRSDQAAFAARPMAEELHGMLVARGLICTRLRILAHTADGDELERTWRHDGALIPADVVDRVRWQCDGWITQASLRRGRGGGGEQVGAITRLALHPVQLLPAGLGAPTLWGSAGESAGRAGRAFARAQGLAGEEAVLVAADVGGRLLSEQVRMIPWRSEPPDAQPGPWPGSLPRPLPATVFRLPPAVQVRAADGGEVEVTTRGVLSAPPVRLLVPRESADALGALETGRWYPVEAYGAPTVLDERWWSPGGHHTVRLPVVVADGAEKQVALLLLCHEEGWRVEGVYD